MAQQKSEEAKHGKDKIANSVPVNADNFTWMFDKTVVLKLTTGEKVKGTIFTYDTIAGIVVIQQSPSGSHSASGLPYQQFSRRSNFRMLRTSQISDISYVASVDSTNGNAAAPHLKDMSSIRPPIAPIAIEKVIARHEQGTRAAQLALAKIGVGVTEDAQFIFDALSRTLPVRWSNQSIVVLDEVIIHPPYTLDACKAPTSAQNALARVKMVLEGERRRLPTRT